MITLRFDEIYTTYFNDVYHFLLALTQDRDLAEEITSETFFKAMKSIDSFRGDCSLSVWLCQIAKNCYYSHLKKDQRTVPDSDRPMGGIPDPQSGPEEQVMDRVEAQRIRQILHTMPEPYKEVFMWRVFAEMSFAQIGAVFGKTSNWACVTYYRARRKILEELEELQ